MPIGVSIFKTSKSVETACIMPSLVTDNIGTSTISAANISWSELIPNGVVSLNPISVNIDDPLVYFNFKSLLPLITISWGSLTLITTPIVSVTKRTLLWILATILLTAIKLLIEPLSFVNDPIWRWLLKFGTPTPSKANSLREKAI